MGAARKSLLYMLHHHFHIIYESSNMVDCFQLGLLPIIRQIKCNGRVLEFLETIETLKDCLGKVSLEASIDGMHNNCIITFIKVVNLPLLLLLLLFFYCIETDS